MLLRASSQVEGEEVGLGGIVDGVASETGVPHEVALIQFAEAGLGDDTELIRECRERVTREMGSEAMIDAACVIANFQRMVKIADATGIPLDAPAAMMTEGIRVDLGLNEYGSADNTPPVPFIRRIFAKLLQPFLPAILRRVASKMNEA